MRVSFFWVARGALLICGIVSILGCSGDSDRGPSSISLRVAPRTYSVTNLRVVPGAMPPSGSAAFRAVPGCQADSEAERCAFEHFDLAKIRCQIYVSGEVFGLTAQSRSDAPVTVTGSYDGCIDRLVCGFIPIQPDGSYARIDLESSSKAISPEGFIGGCGEIGTILCTSERSGCSEDGFDCTYDLRCSLTA